MGGAVAVADRATRLLARVFPAAELIRTLAQRLIGYQTQIEFKRPRHRDGGLTDTAHEGGGFAHVQFAVLALRDRLNPGKQALAGQLGHARRGQVAKAPDGGKILGRFEPLFRVAGVTGKPIFPAFHDVLPSRVRVLLGDGQGIGVQATQTLLRSFTP